MNEDFNVRWSIFLNLFKEANESISAEAQQKIHYREDDKSIEMFFLFRGIHYRCKLSKDDIKEIIGEQNEEPIEAFKYMHLSLGIEVEADAEVLEVEPSIPGANPIEVQDAPKRIIKEMSDEELLRIGQTLSIDWEKYDFAQFKMGMVVELEHGVENPQTNVTNSDPLTTAKIVLAHLNEMPDYYTKLRVMEQKKLDVAIKKYITIEKKMGEEALESVRDYIREHITASMEFLIRGILRKLRKEKHRIPDDPEMVVRTELNRVQNEETLDYAKEHDLKLEWVTFKRSCPLCAQMDGKIVEAGKNFKHPETGETLKNPPLHCNCRCSLVERED